MIWYPARTCPFVPRAGDLIRYTNMVFTRIVAANASPPYSASNPNLTVRTFRVGDCSHTTGTYTYTWHRWKLFHSHPEVARILCPKETL